MESCACPPLLTRAREGMERKSECVRVSLEWESAENMDHDSPVQAKHYECSVKAGSEDGAASIQAKVLRGKVRNGSVALAL